MTVRTFTNVSTRDAQTIASHIANRYDFQTYGALSGRNGTFTRWDAGRLPVEFVEEFTGAGYAVFSYGTPIAWSRHGVWTVPDARYSVTTTRHQGTTRYALHIAGEPVAERDAA